MNTRTLVAFFIMLLSLQTNAQIQILAKDHFFFESNVSIGENPIERDVKLMLSHSERPAFHFNLETLIGYEYNAKWFAQLGIQYAMSKYHYRELIEIEISNPDSETVFRNDFQIALTNSFRDFDSNITIEINQDSCQTSRYINDGDSFGVGTITENIIRTIGIPIKIGRFIGSKKLRFFTSIGMIPQFVINKKMTSNRGKKPTTGVSFGNKRNCWNHSGEEIERVNVSTVTETKEWNLQDKRLDLIAEIGVVHRIKSNSFKFGIYYGESITPFSKTNIANYKLKTYGLKIGFAFI